MKKLLAMILLALILTGCATYDINFNKFAEQTNNNG